MFIEKPASKASLSKRKPVYGVGINDADYIVSLNIRNKSFKCPFYKKWCSMLKRCYCKKEQEKHPTYKGCSVCEEWLTFSNFKAWMVKQDWKGKELDKDLLFQGNKVYSPKTCIFIAKQINTLLNDCRSSRGKHPIGVNFCERDNIFASKCRVEGKTKNIGSFKTPEEAYEAYKKFKYALIKEVALKQSEPLKSALLSYKIS